MRTKPGKKFKICIIGTGYVGLVSGACLAEIGHNVICVDNNKKKIKTLQAGFCPIYEPGLKKMIAKNKRAGRLFFSTNLAESVKKSDIIFIAVHTPTRENRKTDLRYVEAVSKEVAKVMDKYKIIISKSTMPVRTGQKIKEIIKKFTAEGINFDIVSNPEFLKEGTAINDFLNPDRIVIGLESDRAKKIMSDIYRPIKAPVIFTDIESAEIIKHACNSFLATKISFINAVANICEKNHGDIKEVARAMGLDKRIGPQFLEAGIGFGGSCFPKDVSAFINVARKCGYNFALLKEVEKINKGQRNKFFQRIERYIPDLKNKKIAIFGLSFKPNTDDIREAPSVDIINKLIGAGCKIKVFDPAAMGKARELFKDKIVYCKDAYSACNSSNALLILTDWPEFKKVDLGKIKRMLKSPIIIDGRNIFDPLKMKKFGFKYISIGRR